MTWTETVESLRQSLDGLRLADLADLAVILLLVSFGFSVLQKRAARVAAVAFGSLVALYAAARLLGMYFTLWLFQAGFTILLLTPIIIFHADIRNWLVQLYYSWVARPGSRGKGGAADTLLEVVGILAANHTGALLVLRGRQPIDLHARGGIPLAGRVSLPLLLSLFHPESPGHDGAVVIADDRVERFGVHLPLSANLGAVGARGTRHAAALGLSESCDALVIVVSEETGTVSVAEGGRLVPAGSAAALKDAVLAFYADRFAPALRLSWKGLGRNLAEKLVAGVLAVAIWSTFAFRDDAVQRTFNDVPVAYHNVPPDWVIADAQPAAVDVTLTGPERAFALLDRTDLTVTIPLESPPREGEHEVVITEQHLPLPPGVSIRQIATRAVEFTAFPVDEVTVPVEPDLVGEVPAPFELTGVEVEPPSVPLTVRRSERRRIPAVRTEPIYLPDVRATTVLRPRLVLPPFARFTEGKQPQVRLTLRVRAAEDLAPADR
ncbi:MAG TPA: diadenylate cyclase [Gemmataceae bacterium]